MQASTELYTSSRVSRPYAITGSSTLRCEDGIERGASEPRVVEGQGHWMGSGGEDSADSNGPSSFISRSCSQGEGREQGPEGLLPSYDGTCDNKQLRAGHVSNIHVGICGGGRSRADRPGRIEIDTWKEGDPTERGSGGGLGVCAATSRPAVSYSILEAEKEIELRAGQLLEAQNYTISGIEDLLLDMKSARLPAARSFMEKKTKEAFTLNLGLYAHGSQAGVMNATFQLPNLCRYLNRWMQEWAPPEARWTTLSLIFNMESKPHRDLHNLKEQPNYLISFGEHEHGELWLERDSDGSRDDELRRRRKPNGSLANGYLLQPRHQVVSFLSDRWHATMPWKGNRIALAAFTARSFRGIDPRLRRRLTNFGFPLWPSSTCLTTSSSFEDQAEDAHVLSQEESQTLLACFNDFQDLVAENFEIEDKKDSLLAFGIGGSSQLA